MIIKDFDKWNERKKEIDLSTTSRRYYHEREILKHVYLYTYDSKI